MTYILLLLAVFLILTQLRRWERLSLGVPLVILALIVASWFPW